MPIKDTTPSRFWANVNCTTPDACWVWQGTPVALGYGGIHWNGKRVYAHRLAWALTYGEIPPGMVVRHRCDNPLCCNPKHLELGTNQDNVNDRVSRGRGATGERHPNVKLSAEDIIRIRERYKNTGISQRKLAKMFGVSQGQIRNIVLGLSWKNLLPK